MSKSSRQEYFDNLSISKSDLDLIADCPYTYKNKIQKESTKAMDIGSLIHSLILEPHEFLDSFTILPEINKRTKEGKELFKKIEDENAGKILITKEEYEDANKIAQSVLNYQPAKKIFEHGISETPFFSEMIASNGLKIPVKCKPDFFYGAEGTLKTYRMLVDIKTTSDGNISGFSKSCRIFGYHMQAAFYIDIVSKFLEEQIDRFLFIVVEKTEPYIVRSYYISDYDLEIGRNKYKRLLDIYAECFQRDFWPIYTVENIADLDQLSISNEITLNLFNEAHQ